MRTRFKLPLVGLPTCYYDFPKDDAGKVVKGHRGALRRLLEMELASARCEFDRLRGYYGELDMRDSLYLSGAMVCIIGAFGRGDLPLFDRILRDLRRYPEVNSHPQAKLAREITEAWILQFLRIETGYPEWMERFDFTRIPEEWKHQCAYLGAKGLPVRSDYRSAYAAASMLLNFDRRRNVLAAFPVYERLTCALSCNELGRKEEAAFWLRQAAEMTCPHGIVLPYLFLSVRLGPVMEDVIRAVSSEAVTKVRRLAPTFFANLIRFRNRFTGGAATTVLTPREFGIAKHLCDGRSYKEIAAKLDVSPGRVNNVVMEIYSKLHIHGKGQLRKFVW